MKIKLMNGTKIIENLINFCLRHNLISSKRLEILSKKSSLSKRLSHRHKSVGYIPNRNGKFFRDVS